MNPKPMPPARLLDAVRAWAEIERKFEVLRREDIPHRFAWRDEALSEWALGYGAEVLAAAMDGELCGEILGQIGEILEAYDPPSAPIAPMFFPDRVRTLTAQAKEKEPGRHAPDFR